MFIGVKLQCGFNIIIVHNHCSYQFWATVMSACFAVTGERWWGGFSCGRATYVAGIWFEQLKMISFELFTFVFFNKYFSFGFSRTLL